MDLLSNYLSNSFQQVQNQLLLSICAMTIVICTRVKRVTLNSSYVTLGLTMQRGASGSLELTA